MTHGLTLGRKRNHREPLLKGHFTVRRDIPTVGQLDTNIIDYY